MLLPVKLFATLFICLISTFSFSQKEDAVAKYLFNDGSTDDEIGKLPAKARGALLTYDRFGNTNSAYYLHGNYSSYINLGTSKVLKPRVATISLWFKVDFPVEAGKGSEVNQILLARCAEGDDFNEAYGIAYVLNTDNVAAWVSESKVKQVAAYTKDSLSLRTWHHAVLCYNDYMMSFYLDGKEVGAMTKNFESKFLESDSVMIGYRNGEKNQRFFNGSIDDIEIYNRVLTKLEIKELYNAPNPNKNAMLWQWFWIGLLSLLVVLISLYFIKRRIKIVVDKEKERNQLIYHAMEQEIKMLKAQMDPHFIFNSLNTILQFIITKQNDKAEIYLTKFSKLIRKLLESNTHETISLADELEILKKYLDIEALRFSEFIISDIHIGANIDVENTFIPHMMIQPFVENSIWHGLLAKKGEKILKLEFEKRDEKTLLCAIEDNGVGRMKSRLSRRREDNSSLAINFIEQRLELMNKKYNANYSLELIDRVNEKNESLGTRVEIIMPMLKKQL